MVLLHNHGLHLRVSAKNFRKSWMDFLIRCQGSVGMQKMRKNVKITAHECTVQPTQPLSTASLSASTVLSGRHGKINLFCCTTHLNEVQN
jgi:hypothetical protein